MSIRRVTLELVREGPPHNQLLSPLTPYFAICGNHEPEVLRVPFEHRALLRKLRTLRYQSSGGPLSASDIAADADDVRRALVDMLRSIRSLSRELSSAARGGNGLVVLELVLSASELALLPFELVFRPGMPERELGGSEVVVVRRTRRVELSQTPWDGRLRVLFAFSSAGGQVPYERHLLALRECLAPWLVHTSLDSAEDAAIELAKYVTVLPDATLPAIRGAFEEKARRDREFSHVHLLAHGAEVDGKFGLVLGSPADRRGRDVVTGDRLAGALMATTSTGDRIVPACVTVAACDSGNAGDVTYSGSALAHDLHEGGVPLVVASQLPLGVRGSVAMVREVYDHLLLVDDPRIALAEMRAAVRTWSLAGAGQMDWASLVAYGALPEGLDRQVAAGRTAQAKRAMESAIGMLDPNVTRGRGKRSAIPPNVDFATALKKAEDARIVAARRFERIAPPAVRARYLGAHYKRWAEICEAAWKAWNERSVTGASSSDSPAAPAVTSASPAIAELREDWRRHFKTAEEHYLEAFSLDGSPSALVQVVVCRVLGGQDLATESGPVALRTTRLWRMAADLFALRKAQNRVHHDQMNRSLLELWMLAPALFSVDERNEAERRVKSLLAGEPEDILFLEVAGGVPDRFDLYSMWRQANRLASSSATGGRDGAAPGGETVRDRAEKVRKRLEEVGAPTTWTAVMDYRRGPDGLEKVESE